MSEHKLITGDKFVAGLMKQGIVGNKTRKVTIEAEVDEPILMTIEEYGDNRLLEMLEDGSVMVVYERDKAICP